MVQTWKKGLRNICVTKNKEDWDLALPYIAMGYKCPNTPLYFISLFTFYFLGDIPIHLFQDHSKNCAPCHLPNLDPTIITSTWIPPLDYPCQLCQRTDDADQMLLCNNCNGGYHLFCLKLELTQVPTGN